MLISDAAAVKNAAIITRSAGRLGHARQLTCQRPDDRAGGRVCELSDGQ